MKATIPWLGSALVAALAVSAAAAQCPGGHGAPQAPDACGPGYYAPNEYGLWFGPNYDLRPSWPPYNGMVLGPSGPRGPGAAAGPNGPGGRMVPYGGPVQFGQVVPGPASFPTHPYARSPRDFFMADVP